MLTLPDDVVRQQLQWRYATKKFDATRKILDQDWRTLEEALVYAPSSYGLQPWKFFIVTDASLRERLRPAAWNQPQITDASHLVVFAVRSNLGTADVDRHLARIAEVRGVSPGSLEGYKQMMLGSLNRPTDEVTNWATHRSTSPWASSLARRPCWASTPARWKASSPRSSTRSWGSPSSDTPRECWRPPGSGPMTTLPRNWPRSDSPMRMSFTIFQDDD